MKERRRDEKALMSSRPYWLGMCTERPVLVFGPVMGTEGVRSPWGVMEGADRSGT